MSRFSLTCPDCGQDSIILRHEPSFPSGHYLVWSCEMEGCEFRASRFIKGRSHHPTSCACRPSIRFRKGYHDEFQPTAEDN